MSKGYWFFVSALGLVIVVIVGAGLIGKALEPTFVEYGNATPPNLEACGYEEAKQAAAIAQAKYDELANSTPPSGLAGIADAEAKAKEAQQHQADAETCEQREHDRSDLAAQWASAEAAKNTALLANKLYWWGVIEVTVIVLALLAAGWAAFETREANRIARDVGEAQLRPVPMILGGGSINLRFRIPTLRMDVSIPLTNGGQTPLFEVDSIVEIFAWQGAISSPGDSNRILFFRDHSAHIPSGGAVHNLKYSPRNGIGIMEFRQAVESNHAEQAVLDASIAARCTINAKDYAGRPTEEYVVWLRMEGDDIPEAAFNRQSGSYTLEQAFESPRFGLWHNEQGSREDGEPHRPFGEEQ